MKRTDKELIKSIREGNPMSSLEEIYRREFPKIRKYIIKNSGTEEDAQDVFQDSVMTLFSYIKKGKFDDNYEIGGFMYIVATNNWKRKNRNKFHKVEIDSSYESTLSVDPYTEMISEEKRNNILALFEQLGESCQQILTDVIFHRMSMKEIAEKNNYKSATTAKTRHYKCKQRLIKLVSDSPSLIEYLKTN